MKLILSLILFCCLIQFYQVEGNSELQESKNADQELFASFNRNEREAEPRNEKSRKIKKNQEKSRKSKKNGKSRKKCTKRKNGDCKNRKKGDNKQSNKSRKNRGKQTNKTKKSNKKTNKQTKTNTQSKQSNKSRRRKNNETRNNKSSRKYKKKALDKKRNQKRKLGKNGAGKWRQDTCSQTLFDYGKDNSVSRTAAARGTRTPKLIKRISDRANKSGTTFQEIIRALEASTLNGTKCRGETIPSAVKNILDTLKKCSTSVPAICDIKKITEPDPQSCVLKLTEFGKKYKDCMFNTAGGDYSKACECLKGVPRPNRPECLPTPFEKVEKQAKELNIKCNKNTETGSWGHCRSQMKMALEFVESGSKGCRSSCAGGATTAAGGATTAAGGATTAAGGTTTNGTALTSQAKAASARIQAADANIGALKKSKDKMNKISGKSRRNTKHKKHNKKERSKRRQKKETCTTQNGVEICTDSSTCTGSNCDTGEDNIPDNIPDCSSLVAKISDLIKAIENNNDSNIVKYSNDVAATTVTDTTGCSPAEKKALEDFLNVVDTHISNEEKEKAEQEQILKDINNQLVAQGIPTISVPGGALLPVAPMSTISGGATTTAGGITTAAGGDTPASGGDTTAGGETTADGGSTNVSGISTTAAGITNQPNPGSAGSTFQLAISYTWSQEPTGADRTAEVVVPTTTAGQKLPVVIYLHGNGGQGNTKPMENIFGTAIVNVAPNGYERSWNINGEKSKADDVSFILDLIAKIGSDIPAADMTDVNIVGSSNGAALTYRLMIETNADRPFHRAFPMVSSLISVQYHDGQFWEAAYNADNPTNDYNIPKVPVFSDDFVYAHFHGTKDGALPYEGASPGAGFLGTNADGTTVDVIAAQKTDYLWAQAMGYTGAQLSDAAGIQVGTTAKPVQEYSYLNGRVKHFKLIDEGHGGAAGHEHVQAVLKLAILGI